MTFLPLAGVLSLRAQTVYNFERPSAGLFLTTQTPGLTFTNATHSGSNVAFDGSGLISFTFKVERADSCRFELLP